MEWDAETIETLRALWAEGLSTAEIGRRMFISKNTVVGKAHRLNLPARPSPIRIGGVKQPAQPRRVTGQTLPTLANDQPPAPTMRSPAGPMQPQQTIAAKLARVEVQALQTIFKARPAAACQWPTSDGKPWTFCCATAAPGRSYCRAHAERAYVKFKAFLAIEPRDLRMVATDMQIDGATTSPLTDLLAEVNRRRGASGQSEFFLPGLPERRPSFGAAANV